LQGFSSCEKPSLATQHQSNSAAASDGEDCRNEKGSAPSECRHQENALNSGSERVYGLFLQGARLGDPLVAAMTFGFPKGRFKDSGLERLHSPQLQGVQETQLTYAIKVCQTAPTR
jgi:hypothetical protein